MENREKPMVIVGSINTDMMIRSDRLPRPGETVIGGTFFQYQGGKGANQAVAAARLGAAVRMIGKVGEDSLGRDSVDSLRCEGIDTSGIFTDLQHPSGVAMILVDSCSENSISVASGANLALTPADIEQAAATIRSCGAVLMQLEIPIPTVEAVVSIAKEAAVPVILNPAPAPRTPLSAELLAGVDILIPNQTEAELIAGIPVNSEEDALRAAEKIAAMGVPVVLITMGARGVFLYRSSDGTHTLIPAEKVTPVDTTAAGDCFCGALTVALMRGQSLQEAVRFANRAAAISVTRQGAQPSLPYLAEVENP